MIIEANLCTLKHSVHNKLLYTKRFTVQKTLDRVRVCPFLTAQLFSHRRITVG